MRRLTKDTRCLRPQSSCSWSLSLADMMTLVLCFFIAIVATTGNQSKEKQDSGIQIADSKSTPRALDVKLAKEWFNTTTWQLTEQGQRRMNEELTSWKDKINSLRISWCLEQEVGSKSEQEFRAMSRTMTLMSQIFDGGVPMRLISIDLAQSNCSSDFGTVEFSRI